MNDQKKDKDEEVSASELMRRRGERDGRAGLNASSTSPEYWEGYIVGRRHRAEEKLRYFQ